MLTRAGVAKRLGKSIATVRRLEGVELHPVRDAAGIHRFDEREVDRLARHSLGRGSTATRREFLHRLAPAPLAGDAARRTSAYEEQLDELRARLTRMEAGAREATDALEAARARAAHAQLQAERERALRAEAEQHAQETVAAEREQRAIREMVDLLDSLPPRQFAQLGPELLDDILELLERAG